MQNMVQTVYKSSEMLVKKPHFHDCHQIILILKGKVTFCVNGVHYSAGAGDIALFSRYEDHAVQVETSAYERYVLHIAPDVVNRKSAVYSLLTDRPVGFSNVIHAAPYITEITEIFERLLRERTADLALGSEMEELTVKQLLITVYRCTAVQFESLQDAVVIGVKRQFENACHEQYTLESLARQYSVSISALSHRFRAVTGVSVMGYLQSCRLAQAKRLLADTDMPVGEIVETCGFSDSSNFSRAFKAVTGISPTHFRKKYTAR